MPIKALWTRYSMPRQRHLNPTRGEQQGMRTIADTPLCSFVGLVVLAAMFLTIWLARDSSAGAGAAAQPAASSVQTAAEPHSLQSARTHRSPVTHTSIPPEQLHQSQGK